MDNIRDEIQDFHNQRKLNILKGFKETEEFFEKAKRKWNIGDTREMNGKKYILQPAKSGTGRLSWIVVKDDKKTEKKQDKKEEKENKENSKNNNSNRASKDIDISSSSRLEMLKKSLEKKEKELAKRLDAHFEDVKRANGQPLNDKRNGRATLNRWERQNEAIRNLKESIEKTKNAIEKEQWKIKNVNYQNENFIPKEILESVEKGELIQWRKHPTHFFVPGVDKARILWDKSRKVVAYKYLHLITDKEQRAKFARIYNDLNAVLNSK